MAPLAPATNTLLRNYYYPLRRIAERPRSREPGLSLPTAVWRPVIFSNVARRLTARYPTATFCPAAFDASQRKLVVLRHDRSLTHFLGELSLRDPVIGPWRLALCGRRRRCPRLCRRLFYSFYRSCLALGLCLLGPDIVATLELEIVLGIALQCIRGL